MTLPKKKPSFQEPAPDVRDLRAFCLVVDLGSITRASERLGETKGSVSRRLSRLEQDVGLSLLRRSPRLVKPTEEGMEYRARVGRALELLDDAHLELRKAGDVPRGLLRVTAPNDLAVAWMAPLVTSFVERFADITVEMLLTERRLDFESDQIDIAIRASSALEDSSLIAHKLRDVEGRLYASRAYLKAHGAPSEPGDLASHRLLMMGPRRSTRPLPIRHDKSGTVISMDLEPILFATDALFVREVAISGGGIALLPSEIVEQAEGADKLVRVLPDHSFFSGAIYFVHQGSRFLSPKVRAFRDHLLGFCPKEGKGRANPGIPGARFPK